MTGFLPRWRLGITCGLAVVLACAGSSIAVAQPAASAASRDVTGRPGPFQRAQVLRLLVEQAAADDRHGRIVRSSASALGGAVAAATGLWLGRRGAGNELRGIQGHLLFTLGTVVSVGGVIDLLRRSTGEQLRDDVHDAGYGERSEALLISAAEEERALRGRRRLGGLAFVGIGEIFAIGFEGDDRYAAQRGAARLTAATFAAFGVWSLGSSYTTGPVENAARTWSRHGGRTAAASPISLSLLPLEGGAAVGVGGRF